MKRIFQVVAFATALLTATGAFAASALVTTDLNLRTGPGTGYARITAMPNGAIVDVRGCTRGYNWCRVAWRGYDGWASSRYLAQQTGRYSGRAYSGYGASIGVPLIAGAIIGGALVDRDSHRYRRHYGRRHFGNHRRFRHHGRRFRHRGRRHGGRRHFGGRSVDRCRGGHRRHHGNC